MRILHVVFGYLPHMFGGTQLHVRDLCAGLRSRGHDCSVFASLSGEESEEYALSQDEWNGVPVTYVTNNFKDVRRFENLYVNKRIDRRFEEVLDSIQPDVVHIHHLTSLSTSIIEVAKRRHLPVVMTLHDYWLMCPRGQRLHPDTSEICVELDRGRCVPCLKGIWQELLDYDEAKTPMDARAAYDRMHLRGGSIHTLGRWETQTRRMTALCDAVIAPSSFHRDRFGEWGVDPEAILAIPHGVPKEKLLAEPRGTKPVQSIGFIGTVIPSKGVHTLIEAFGELDRPELTLHIHGDEPVFHGDSEYGTRMRAGIRKELNVEFHGAYEHKDLPEILAKLDVLVIPALWWETFCLTVREGALAGLPVVASRIGAITEAIDRGLALGFEPGNAKQLATVLEDLIGDESKRDAMSRRAHLVKDIATCVEETEKVYERSLASVSAS